MRSTRVIAVAAVVVFVALVASAVVLADAAPGAPRVVTSDLVVGAGPPTTATGILTYSDSNGITIRASCALDFVDGTANVSATASLSVVTVSAEARLVDRAIYLELPQFASLVGSPWVSTGALDGPARLEDLARTMRHPELSALHPTSRTVVHAPSGATTTTMGFGVVNVPFASELPISVPSPARLTVTVTTGTQGQLLRVAAGLRAPGDVVLVGFVVTGYDVPVSIAPPPPGDVVVLTPATARALFGTDAGTVDRLLRGLRRVAG